MWSNNSFRYSDIVIVYIYRYTCIHRNGDLRTGCKNKVPSRVTWINDGLSRFIFVSSRMIYNDMYVYICT